MNAEKKEKILIVTGGGAFGEKLADVLHRHGYSSVHLVKNGVEGLKAICDFLPHLVLLDVTLPGIDGYEVLKQKMSETLLAKIPVFLMSSQGVPINMRSVPAGSVSEYLTALHLDSEEVAGKIDRYFMHETGNKVSKEIKPKLLWVEDDRLIGKILSQKLLDSGFDLYHAKNGEEAVEILKKVIPDLVAVDLMLPGMSGFDVLQKMEMDSQLKKIPKMVLTNLSKPSDIEKAKILGASKFIVKAATSLDKIVAEMQAMLLKS